MKLTIDTETKTLLIEEGQSSRSLNLYSKESFKLISHQWLKVGWNEKYPYVFSWMGRPIIQIPEDIIRIQEVIFRLRPDVIIETGIAHGGSLILYACLCKAMGNGRIIGIDVEIRPHNRSALDHHELRPYLTLIEGGSTDPEIVRQVRSLVNPEESVLVILDSDHTKQHVAAELDAYASLVTRGSYIVATDGSMRDLHDVPRGKPEWIWDNPASVAEEFAKNHADFVLEQPQWPFNESELDTNITHWPSAWLRRL